ncbi:hypothetical protein GCK32_021720 [Trichostrongylus colubriformis]|uniref:Uncharacterized protein n=1 Tax=Trichostrongylus colubriformis TaxID=6319 RepID=A0AAN8FEM3_TRICO
MSPKKEGDTLTLVLELCQKVVSLDVSPEDAFEKLQDLRASNPLLPSLLLDVLVVIEGDVQSSEKKDKAVQKFTDFVNLIADQVSSSSSSIIFSFQLLFHYNFFTWQGGEPPSLSGGTKSEFIADRLHPWDWCLIFVARVMPLEQRRSWKTRVAATGPSAPHSFSVCHEHLPIGEI